MLLHTVRYSAALSVVQKQLAFKYPFLCGSRLLSTSNTMKERYYTLKHEWLELEQPTRGGVGTVGITDYAQKTLGDVVYVELPEVHTNLVMEESAGAIESVKAASDLYAPVSGEVVECNSEVQEKPHLVNKYCYEKGWLYKLKIADPSELSKLMTEQAYEEFAALEENKENETQKF